MDGQRHATASLPRERHSVPILQEDEWARGPDLTEPWSTYIKCCEILVKPVEEAGVTSLSINPFIHGIRNFISVFTKSRNWCYLEQI
jgi:hypothetical protein